MKEYKYKINGTEYTVAINKIDDKEAELEVNGTPFNVEILTEKKKKAAAPTIKRPQPAQPVEKVTKPTTSSSSSTAVPHSTRKLPCVSTQPLGRPVVPDV